MIDKLSLNKKLSDLNKNTAMLNNFSKISLGDLKKSIKDQWAIFYGLQISIQIIINKNFSKILNVPMVGVFEPSFHYSLPELRRPLGFPWDWYERLGIKKFGFHGASHRYLSAWLHILQRGLLRRAGFNS